MLYFGRAYNLPQSAQYWTPAAALPADIKLDAAANVTGIDTQLPSDTRFGLSLKGTAGNSGFIASFISGARQAIIGLVELGGNIFSGVRFGNGNEILGVGIDENAMQSSIEYVNTATGQGSYIVAEQGKLTNRVENLSTGESVENEKDTFPLQDVTNINAAGLASQRQQQSGGISDTVTNLVSGEFSETGQGTGEIEGVVVGLANRMAYLQFEDRWELQGNGTRVFMIDVNGAVRTNQTIAAALKVPNGNYIEVFDLAGVSVGFIQLTT